MILFLCAKCSAHQVRRRCCTYCCHSVQCCPPKMSPRPVNNVLWLYLLENIVPPQWTIWALVGWQQAIWSCLTSLTGLWDYGGYCVLDSCPGRLQCKTMKMKHQTVLPLPWRHWIWSAECTAPAIFFLSFLPSFVMIPIWGHVRQGQMEIVNVAGHRWQQVGSKCFENKLQSLPSIHRRFMYNF